MTSSNTKNMLISDDRTAQQTSSKDSEELNSSAQKLAVEEFSSMIDAVPKLSLESTKGKPSRPLSQIVRLIRELKLLDEKEKKLEKNLLL